MFNLGGMEILVILVVALLVLGPEKLPNAMRTLGKIFGEFRRTSTEFTRAIQIDIGAPPALNANATPESALSPKPDRRISTARKRPLPRSVRVRRERTRLGSDRGKL